MNRLTEASSIIKTLDGEEKDPNSIYWKGDATYRVAVIHELESYRVIEQARKLDLSILDKRIDLLNDILNRLC